MLIIQSRAHRTSPLKGELIDDNRACALEYNVVRWGKTELPPEAGIAVYVRGKSGKLAAARIYDDVNPPLRSPM